MFQDTSDFTLIIHKRLPAFLFLSQRSGRVQTSTGEIRRTQRGSYAGSKHVVHHVRRLFLLFLDGKCLFNSVIISHILSFRETNMVVYIWIGFAMF